jgi:hypothetical protein
MIGRACAVWLILLVASMVNGALRESLLVPLAGEDAAHALSTVVLCIVIILVARATMRWIDPATPGEAWTIGAFWLALTVAFEFLAGHYVFGTPWAVLVEDYDIINGRTWVLVLLTTVVAPQLFMRDTDAVSRRA